MSCLKAQFTACFLSERADGMMLLSAIDLPLQQLTSELVRNAERLQTGLFVLLAQLIGLSGYADNKANQLCAGGWFRSRGSEEGFNPLAENEKDGVGLSNHHHAAENSAELLAPDLLFIGQDAC